MDGTRIFTTFAGRRRIASGELAAAAVAAKRAHEESTETVLIFNDAGNVIDVDLRGSHDDIRRRLSPGGAAPASTASAESGPKRGPGRPKLGVVAREVTLLPRHWEWLASQPGGASVALRKLVEGARRSGADTEKVRLSREAAYRFMSAIAGDEPGFEEAARALFAGNRARFAEFSGAWPSDIRDHARQLAEPAFGQAAETASVPG